MRRFVQFGIIDVILLLSLSRRNTAFVIQKRCLPLKKGVGRCNGLSFLENRKREDVSAVLLKSGSMGIPSFDSKKMKRVFETNESDTAGSGEDAKEKIYPWKENVRVQSTDVVPILPKEAIVDVYYVEQTISALGVIGEVIEGYHTGIVFELRDGEKAEEWGVPREFTIEWYAVNFPFGAFLPSVVDVEPTSNPAGLRWENEAHPFYWPSYKPERWTKGRTLIGWFDGEGYSEYIKWVVEYDALHPGYQAFEVWDRPLLEPNKTRRWVESFTCSTFAELSLREMWKFGGKSETPKQIIRRSYVPVVAKTKPQQVDVSDPKQAQQVRDFYIELNKAARGVNGESLTTSEFIRLLADDLEIFYVYDTPNDLYTRVELAPPYFAIANLYQPMSLPWQKFDMYGDGEMVDPGAFAPKGSQEDDFEPKSFTEELSSAAGSVSKLLQRRVPPIIKQKIGPKSILVLPALALLLIISLLPKDAAINESFVIGLLIGVPLGRFTSNK